MPEPVTPNNAAPETPAAPQKPVEQTLGSGLQDTTDSEWSDNVVAFDAADDGVAITSQRQDSAPEQPAIPAAAPVVKSEPVEPPAAVAVQVQVPAAVPPPSVAPAAESAPVAPPTPPPAQAAPQAPAAQQTPPPQQPVQQAAPAEQPLDMAGAAQQLQANQAQVVDALARAHYGLNQEELDSLNVNPAEVIPKMLAKVHVNSVSATLHHVAQQLPRMILGIMDARQRNVENENKFYSNWPQLDRTKHGPVVAQIAQVYRQMNPNATPEDFVRQVGAQAVVALGLLQPSGVPAAPTAPAARQAFVPAAISAPASRAPAQPQNIFEQLGDLILADDS